MPGWESIHSGHQDEYVLLEITQEREDDEPGEDPKRYKCLDMDVAQPHQIWNVTMGEVEAELKGHTGWVMSVAFAQDGS